jgi:hypothetical protein
VNAKRKTPAGLGRRGGAFWRQAVATYEFTEPEFVILHEACRTLAEIEDLEAALTSGELMVAGSTGQPRVHPAVAELRQHRLALGKLLASLALPDEDDEKPSLPAPATVQARSAARSRWTHRALTAAERRARGTSA